MSTTTLYFYCILLSGVSFNQVANAFDTYKSYSLGFMIVGVLSVVGALILPAITMFRHCKGRMKQMGRTEPMNEVYVAHNEVYVAHNEAFEVSESVSRSESIEKAKNIVVPSPPQELYSDRGVECVQNE